MPGIYIMAIITSLITAGLIGSQLYKYSKPNTRATLLLVVMLSIPTFYIAYYGLRIPIINIIEANIETQSYLLLLIKSWYAPLTEEAIKLLIALGCWRIITKKHIALTAFSIGLGFGLGEIWFIAHSVTLNPEFASLPWYLFFAFLVERTIVTFLHGAFVYLAIRLIAKKQVLRGVITGMLAHWIVNAPIFLVIVFNLPATMFWQTIVGAWVPIYAIILISYIAKTRKNKQKPLPLLGTDTCPKCHKTYNRPPFAIALFTKRYERCPKCKRWNLL